MATYISSKAASTVQPRIGIDTVVVFGSYTVSTNLATNDVIQLVKIPAGATVIELIIQCTASLASTASCVVGDGIVTNRYISASSYAAAALYRLNSTTTGLGYTYTADDTIDLLCSTITTPATGAVINIAVTYTMQS